VTHIIVGLWGEAAALVERVEAGMHCNAVDDLDGTGGAGKDDVGVGWVTIGDVGVLPRVVLVGADDLEGSCERGERPPYAPCPLNGALGYQT
jgi:hypothetical protein